MMTEFKKIFIDTTPFIYWFTMDSVLHGKTEEIFKAILNSGCEIFGNFSKMLRLLRMT